MQHPHVSESFDDSDDTSLSDSSESMQGGRKAGRGWKTREFYKAAIEAAHEKQECDRIEGAWILQQREKELQAGWKDEVCKIYYLVCLWSEA